MIILQVFLLQILALIIICVDHAGKSESHIMCRSAYLKSFVLAFQNNNRYVLRSCLFKQQILTKERNMMRKVSAVTLLGMAVLAATSLSAFQGRGWNSEKERYQWDSGFHGTVSSIFSDTIDSDLVPFPTKVGANPYYGVVPGQLPVVQLAYEPGPDLSDDNAPSTAQGFDTYHRGKSKDKIAAVRIGFMDINQYSRGLASVLGEGTQGITQALLSPIGKTVTIGIWQAGKNGYDGNQNNQRRDNALFTMDYRIKGEDVGVEDATEFTIKTPEYILDEPAFTGIYPSNTLRVTTASKVKTGDGSNTRPLKFYPSELYDVTSILTYLQNPKPPISSTHPDHRHISRAGNFAFQYGVHGPKPFPKSDYEAPFTQAPFSQYKTKFTTLPLKNKHGKHTAVTVHGEFWVGILVDIDMANLEGAQAQGWFVPQTDNPSGRNYYDLSGNYLPPPDYDGSNGWDDVGYNVVGTSCVDLSAPGPGGISYAGMVTSGYQDPWGTLPRTPSLLRNNNLFPGNFDAPEILGGFTPAVYSVAIGQSNVGSYEDTFYSIQAVPEDSWRRRHTSSSSDSSGSSSDSHYRHHHR